MELLDLPVTIIRSFRNQKADNLRAGHQASFQCPDDETDDDGPGCGKKCAPGGSPDTGSGLVFVDVMFLFC